MYGLVAPGTLANGPPTLVEDCRTKDGLAQLSTNPPELFWIDSGIGMGAVEGSVENIQFAMRAWALVVG